MTGGVQELPLRRMGRTVIVGDVHGCLAELEVLLRVVQVVEADSVVFVGDLVSRGPDSRGVVRLARRLGARAVLGNHEWRLVQTWRQRDVPVEGPPLSPRQLALLRTLSREERAWLEGLPLFIDLPEHGMRIVHGGIVPGVPIEELGPEVLTRLRSFGNDGQPSDRLGDESWAARYRDSPHVVFGHDARRGLQLHPNATGLDTGCVYGGELSALVLEPGALVPVDPALRRQCIVSVPAKRAYVKPRASPPSRSGLG